MMLGFLPIRKPREIMGYLGTMRYSHLPTEEQQQKKTLVVILFIYLFKGKLHSDTLQLKFVKDTVL